LQPHSGSQLPLKLISLPQWTVAALASMAPLIHRLGAVRFNPLKLEDSLNRIQSD